MMLPETSGTVKDHAVPFNGHPPPSGLATARISGNPA